MSVVLQLLRDYKNEILDGNSLCEAAALLAVEAEFKAMQSRIESLEKDAARYRKCLMNAKACINSMKAEAENGAIGDKRMMRYACEQISKEGLEASLAIDAAMQARKVASEQMK